MGRWWTIAVTLWVGCSSEAGGVDGVDATPTADGAVTPDSPGGDPLDTGARATDSGAASDTPPAESSAPTDTRVDAPADPFAASCVTKINAYRAKVGAAPVVVHPETLACADGQAKKGAADLAASGKTTFHKYFGECKEGYQNECWFSAAPLDADLDWCLDAFWKEGPPTSGINHYSVMVDPKAKSVACGFAPLAGGGHWITHDYYH